MQQTHTLIVTRLAAGYSEKLSTALTNRGKMYEHFVDSGVDHRLLCLQLVTKC